MPGNMFSHFIPFLLLIAHSTAQSSSNKFWILLEDTSVLTCSGITNKFHINEKDVSVKNNRGRSVHYIEAPGRYVLSFRNIKVDEPLPNLAGQMNCRLQVPVVEVGKVLSWDVPYDVVPEQSMFGGSYKCDKQSGVVQDEGKTFCRYCDLCTTTDQVEHMLNREHKFLPNVAGSSEEPFSKVCTQIDSKTYMITRTIDLPDKETFNNIINKKFTGVGGQLKKKLNRGKGKLQTLLEVISSDQEPLDRQTAYSSSSSCRCCLSGVNDLTCKINILGGCNQDRCNSEYAQKCIRGNPKKVGCFVVQMNYQVTDDPNVVKEYLQKNHYQDEYNDFGGSGSSTGSRTGNGNGSKPSNGNKANSGNTGNRVNNGNSANSGSNRNGGGNSGSSNGQKDQKCLSKMEPRFRRLCESQWHDRPCCNLCDGGCH